MPCRFKKAGQRVCRRISLPRIVSVAAVPSVCPTPWERRPRNSTDANSGPHEPAERRRLLPRDALPQPFVGPTAIVATAAAPVLEVVLYATLDPAVIGEHRAAIRREGVRRPICGRAWAHPIRLLLDRAAAGSLRKGSMVCSFGVQAVTQRALRASTDETRVIRDDAPLFSRIPTAKPFRHGRKDTGHAAR